MDSVKDLKILIVEDELIIAELLKSIVDGFGHQSQVFHSFLPAKQALENEYFDIAILDISLDGEHHGVKLGNLCEHQNIPFFFVTSYTDHKTISSAKEAKPGAYILKPFSSEDILVGIEMTMMHHCVSKISELDSISRALELSERESEILNYLSERLTNIEISEKLCLSINTVKYHLKRLYIKLGIDSRSNLSERLISLKSEYG